MSYLVPIFGNIPAWIWWGKNRGKPQGTLVKIVGFMTDAELLKAWINTT